MEQGVGLSMISPPGVTENSDVKSKSIGITLRSNSSLRHAKEKLKSPYFQELIKIDMSIRQGFTMGLAEMMGTAILVFIGCTGCIGSLGISPPLVQKSLSFGLAVMIAIQAIGHISGAHINPAVSVAALIMGSVSLSKFLLYIAAQCIGGILGYGLIKVMTPENLMHYGDPMTKSSFCSTMIHEELSVLQGLFAEVIATGILVFFTCGVWDIRNKNNTDSVSLRFAFCVSVLCFVFVPYTGCSMNPARSLAPAIWNGYWSNHWVFWLGPILGALISSLLYRYAFQLHQSPNHNDIGQDMNTLNGVQT